MRALRVSLGTSRRLLWGLLVVHGGALACLLPLALPLALKLGLGGLMFASLSYTVADQACRRLRHSVVTVISLADGRWTIVTRGGQTRTTTLACGSYVHPQLIVLRFEKVTPRQRRSLTLLPDMVAEDVFRRLRVRLRCGVAGNSDAQVS